MRKSMLWCFILFSIKASSIYAYDNTVTHRYLTHQAILSSIIGVSSQHFLKIIGSEYLVDNSIQIREKLVTDLTQDGADFEDEPPDGSKPCRAANHFHNPIKGWQEEEVSPRIRRR